MTASNLAICFAPSLFHVYGVHSGSSSAAASNGTALGRASPRRDGKHASGSGLPDENELIEQKAALDCLTFMIVNVNDLFTVNVPHTHCRAAHVLLCIMVDEIAPLIRRF